MAPNGSAIKAWPSGQIMATPMITRRGGYPVRYAKPVALASLTRSITHLTQDRRAPFSPSRALPDLEYLGEVGSMGSTPGRPGARDDAPVRVAFRARNSVGTRD
jgi:hypothetical protein